MSRMLIYMTPFVLLLIPLGITIKNHKDSKILKVVEQNIKRIKLIWLFVIEWILATASVLSGLRYLSYWWDDRKFSIVSLILIVVFVYIFCVYFYYIFKRMKDRIDLLFVLFMIPIGISFMFVMLPDYVPDEQSHFQRAYLISNLNIKTIKEVYIDSDYGIQKLKSEPNLFLTSSTISSLISDKKISLFLKSIRFSCHNLPLPQPSSNSLLTLEKSI